MAGWVGSRRGSREITGRRTAYSVQRRGPEEPLANGALSARREARSSDGRGQCQV